MAGSLICVRYATVLRGLRSEVLECRVQPGRELDPQIVERQSGHPFSYSAMSSHDGNLQGNLSSNRQKCHRL
ncbi:hypothetical protein Q7C36_008080 [Tachysurus vachellii]|uniref:Uncharacterized protein n=1 Tax=Tachysurus vachellii TaxID=175792 RepID=A0AA88N7F7_TACVA|nr:hypothetical protein Q7C36_008080 [Tachysurus vachellii]